MGERPIKKAPEHLQGHAEMAHYVNEGKRVALDHIRNTYGAKTPNRENVLFYHGEWHTEGVVARAVKIMETMHRADPSLVKEEDIEAAKLAASFHDTVQNWKVDNSQTWGTPGVTMKKRKRFVGENEGASASLARQYMAKANLVAGHRVFSDRFMDQVDAAIMLTTPRGWDGQTVFHPDFAKASLIAKAVELADLGGSGMHGAKMALHEALTLFPEENMDFREDADRILKGSRRDASHVAPDQQTLYKERLIDWLQRQQRFVEGRKNRILQRSADTGGEIASLPPSVREAVRGLFKDTYFGDSIQALRVLEEQYTSLPAANIPKELFAVIKNPPKITW